MRKEPEQKLANRWPKWFELEGDPAKHSCVTVFSTQTAGSISSGDCASKSKRWLTRGNPLRLPRSKRNLVGLRFYIDGANKAIFALIATAEEESFHICEVCGQPGRLRSGGWVRTRCDEYSIADAP
jgi:hypothetical protein